MADRRWVCPTCESGVNAPEKCRRDDVRRYCFPCSEKSGRLVMRVIPAVERQRQEKEAARKEQAARARAERGEKRYAIARSAEALELLRGIDIATLCRRAQRAALRHIPIGGLSASRLFVMLSATARPGSSPGWVMANAIDDAFEYMTHSERYRFCYEIAEAMYGVRSSGRSRAEDVVENLQGPLNDLVRRVQPLHRAIALAAPLAGISVARVRTYKPLVGTMLEVLGSAIDAQPIGPEYPSVREAVRSGGFTALSRIYPELIVPPPETILDKPAAGGDTQNTESA